MSISIYPNLSTEICEILHIECLSIDNWFFNIYFRKLMKLVAWNSKLNAILRNKIKAMNRIQGFPRFIGWFP